MQMCCNIIQINSNEPLDNQSGEDNIKVVKNKLQKTNSIKRKDSNNQNNIDYPLSVQNQNTNTQLNNSDRIQEIKYYINCAN